MTIDSWLRSATLTLARTGIHSARLDAELLLGHILKKNRLQLAARPELSLTEWQLSQADILLEKRALREPVAYLVGSKDFYGHEFLVTPATLIPRPETEDLIDIIKENLAPAPELAILDVGTGSGCIGLTLHAELVNVSLTLADISDEALVVARQNARRLKISPVAYVHSDLLSYWLEPGRMQKFAVIAANLPYVDRSWQTSPEIDHEPPLALFAADSGLALIKKLICQALPFIAPNGLLALEADPRQHQAIIDFGQKNGYWSLASRNFALILIPD